MRSPPLIDPRSAADIAAKVRKRLAQYLPEWQRRKPGEPRKPDPGEALVGIFAHFAGIIIDRLNRTPDKAFLAFLDLIGASRLPPEAARAPLTFHLAAGATRDARVPAGSRVAAIAGPGEAEPPVFETTGELMLTAAELVAAQVGDPAHGGSDLKALIGAAVPAAPSVSVFRDEATSAVYLGFRRPGAAVAFANQPVSLYVGVEESTDRSSTEGVPTDARPPGVAWEYRSNAQDWSALGAQDGTAGLTRRGVVTFIGPADIAATDVFGQSACWLRVRRLGGVSAVPPRVNRFVTNTIWAHHATSIVNEVIGSGNTEPGQVFHTRMTPVLTGQYVEVAEPDPPAAADRAVLEAEEGTSCVTVVTDDTGKAAQVWVRWHEVPDFHGSLPGSRHYAIDRLSGVVRFGGEGHGRAPPRGANNIRITYRAGGGSVGNRPAGSITQLKSAIPYVDSVTNPDAAAGGADAQSLDEVRRHAPAMLRHQNRAVAIADYEDLAFDASPQVARAKGIPPLTAARAGTVELVVVPRSDAPRPQPSRELLRRVKEHVGALAPPAVDLVVRGPDWLAVSVTVELVPATLEQAMELPGAVSARLATFLDPLTGGSEGRGWAFGRLPHRSEFDALIESIPGVDHIRGLTIALKSDAPPDGAATLVCAGDVTVTLVALATNDA